MEEDIEILRIEKERLSRIQSNKRILEARIAYCKRRFIVHLPFVRIENEDLRKCWIEDCTHEVLLGRYFICPKHLSVHSCQPGSCKMNYENRCVFADSPYEREALIEQVIPHSYGIENAKTSRLEVRGQQLNRHFENDMLQVISNICNREKRLLHNRNEERRQVKIPPGSCVMEQLLLERDVKMLTLTLFSNCDKKKDLRLLHCCGQSVTYYLLQKITHGIYDEGKSLFFLRYARWLSPLPSRVKFCKHFGIELKKFAGCLKIVQYLLNKRTVKCNISNKP